MEKRQLKAAGSLAFRIIRAFFDPMTVTLNGSKREFPESMPMPALLEALGLAGKPVVVEQNQVALLPRELDEAVVKDGDVLEVVQITAGG